MNPNLVFLLAIAPIIQTAVLLIGAVFAGVQLHWMRKSAEVSAEALEAARKAQLQALDLHLADHQWRKLKATKDHLITDVNKDALARVNAAIDYENRNEPVPVATLKELIAKTPQLQQDIHSLLNYYESVCHGFFQGIYDETAIRAARGTRMSRTFFCFEPYIRHRRETIRNPKAWVDFEAMVTRWKHHDSQRDPQKLDSDLLPRQLGMSSIPEPAP